MKVLFAGSPEIAVPLLERLAEAHKVQVLTNPDMPSGRGRKLTPNPVKHRSLELGLPVHQPQKLDREFRETLIPWEPEILVSFAFGKIFGPKFLGLFPQGGINVHPSLLPRYRGPSPIPAAILAGESQTGISIQKLALAMDAGDILAQEIWPLKGEETTLSLSEYAAQRGAVLVAAGPRRLEDIHPECQSSGGTQGDILHPH
jgi:methionyl-tRNA formyltransferase